MGGSPTLGGIFTERVVVGVGDMAASNNPNVTISTYALGSCIGVVAYDPLANVGGMLHFMLPDSTLTPEKAISQPSMFADTGLTALLRTLMNFKAEKRRLRILIAGGANVLSGNDIFKIGERNIVAIKNSLNRERIPIRAEEIGGLNNRTLHFQIKTGAIQIKLPQGLKTVNLK